MGRTSKRYADYAREKNLRNKTHYFRMFKRMLVSRFEWVGLPHTIPSDFIEDALFKHGFIIYHQEFGFPQFSVGSIEGINLYNQPTRVRIQDATGMNQVIDDPNRFVVIYNDVMKEPSTLDVEFFAENLQEIRKTLNVNLKQLKAPMVVGCSESQLTSVKDFYSKLDDGVPFIPVEKDFLDTNSFEVLDLKATSHVRELMEMETTEISSALTYFGINNVNILKKERLVTGEVESNNEQIDNSLSIYLTPRQKACDEIYEKFGVSFDVRVKESAVTYGDIEESEVQEHEDDTSIRLDEE